MKYHYTNPFTFALLSLTLIMIACSKDSSDQETEAPQVPAIKVVYSAKEIYHYSFTSLEGKNIPISKYKGKKIMFVNTASLCSNTPQYEKLEALYKKYAGKLVILGFPCNQFGGQEPGDNGDIEKFCTNNYHLTFPISRKIDVYGPMQDSIYLWLTSKEMNGKRTTTVDWNFQKYLVNEKGEFMAMFENYTQPDDASIIAAIEQ